MPLVGVQEGAHTSNLLSNRSKCVSQKKNQFACDGIMNEVSCSLNGHMVTNDPGTEPGSEIKTKQV